MTVISAGEGRKIMSPGPPSTNMGSDPPSFPPLETAEGKKEKEDRSVSNRQKCIEFRAGDMAGG